MFRNVFLAAFAATLVTVSASADEFDLDHAEDLAYYTPDYHGAIAPLDWDPENSPVHEGLSYRMLGWLEYEYERVSLDINRRFAGHHMVLVEGCGGYLQCGVLFDLKTGRPMTQLPIAGVGGYEFYSDCDLLGVHPPDEKDPSKATHIVFYRLTVDGLVPLAERYPDCVTYTGAID